MALRITYPEALPVSQRRQEIAEAIRDHQVVIVAGETGSGKTTQLPKICLELGRGTEAMIGHTQPRRLAARTVADRIASELGVELGSTVGYAVRFTDRVGPATQVKLMTDGILLAELRRDRQLRAYDTIIVDEAHERSLNIDFLLGYLARLLPSRPELRVIVTSATIETDRFSAHFGGAPVIEVTGRTYPVEMRYRPLEADQLSGIVDGVRELQRDTTGDILVFLSGEREIRDTAEALRDLGLAETEVLPLYARLPQAEQHRVFAPHRGRRVVLATNVAETSLTVPGIRSVIDPGTARISRYSTRLKVQRLPIEPVSQASANQRAGRCGRVADGVCLRLYGEDDYLARPEFTEPEILRTNLASVILAMTAIGLGDVGSFPFLDPPDRRAVADGVRLLDELGALEHAGGSGPAPDGRGLRLTRVGRQLARLPVDPRLARMVLEGGRNGCLREVLIIASGLAIQDPRERPTKEQAAADQAHARFADPTSDFLALVNLWDHLRDRQRELSSSAFRRLCRREHVNFLRVREWQDVHAQLRQVASDLGLAVNHQPAPPDQVHRSLLAGLLSHLGHKDPERREFVGARNARFTIFPGSSLARRLPDWVMVAELVETSRLFGRVAARIEPDWAEALAGHLVKRSYSEPHWSSKRAAAMAYERVTLYGLPLVVDRVVGYHRIDAEHARQLFVRHALVEGDWTTHHRFVAANRALLDELEELEQRFRRRDLVVGLDALEQLYDERIPAEVVSGRTFDRWWSEVRRQQPDLLTFTADDLLHEEADELDEDAFPAVWRQGELELGLSYAFEPGQADDGVAVHIPVDVLNQVEDQGFDWLVPGLRVELVGELIRSLPKAKRRGVVPVPETVARFLDEVPAGSEPLLGALESRLSQWGGEPIGRSDWDRGRLPPHLRLLFLVVDDDDQVLAQGEDLRRLQAEMAGQIRLRVAAAGAELERGGLTRWEVGEIPRQVELTRGATRVVGYPAVVDEGETVGLRVLDTADAQHEAHWAGVRRLVRLSVGVPLRSILRDLPTEAQLALTQSPYPSTAALLDDCVTAALDQVMADAGAPVWDQVSFDRVRRRASGELGAGAATTIRSVADLLAVDRQVGQRLEQLAGSAAGAGSGAAVVVDDVAAQRGGLVYDGFVSGVGVERLVDVARYLRAILVRLDRRRESPGRDDQLMAEVHSVQADYERLLDRLEPARAGAPEVIDLAWLIEELRVSLFAQSLGTSTPVSTKRVRSAVAALMA